MSIETAEPAGDLATALAHGARLLARAPRLAVRQAQEILAVMPGQREAILLLAQALRAAGDPAQAAEVLRGAVAARPADFAAWGDLADTLLDLGDAEAAADAYMREVDASVIDPVLVDAAVALREGRLHVAEQALRVRLLARPTDVAAIRMLAEVAAQLGRYEDAGNLLSRALELCPGFHQARRAQAQVLQRQERPAEALAEVERLLAIDPQDVNSMTLKASLLVRLGEFQEGLSLYGRALERLPTQPKIWMSYGHVLKTVGRQADGVAAYQRAVDQAPDLGEAWWSLANLKTFRFRDQDLEVMARQLERPDLMEDDRLHLHFALAKALEDQGDYAGAFDHYSQGNAIRRDQLRHHIDSGPENARRARAFFDKAFFESRKGVGCPAPDPIFIVGLPRAGSTLLEQILASHSQVEGTMELPDLPYLVRGLSERKTRGDDSLYPEILASLTPADLKALGEEYLERTRIQRKTDKPYFIDKLPNNWPHVGLIQLILPNAKIIDARRHPMGCCLSGFKQHFARGQGFSYDLGDIGRYYRDYVALMRHMDQVLPGRVHRVVYEQMVADTEGEVRRLLDYAGLPFEDACLAFWANDRAVRTASSEQVRRPIFSDAVDHWRHFEPWLDPLKQALGPVLAAYPDAPVE